MTEEQAKKVTDQNEIVSVINQFFFSVDERDYETMRACLTERVNFDYSRLFGTEMPPSAEELVENVRQNHAGLQATQHLTANHFVKVEDDKAECTANF